MNGQTISWNEASPANTDLAGSGDDEIRSTKTALRTALNDEHNFPSTGGANTGYHRFGSARPFYGAISACSSSGTVARLYQTSNTSELYADTGAAVFPVGGLFSLLGANAAGVYTPTAGSKYAVQFGLSSVTASTGYVTTITYSGSGYSGVPLVFVVPQTMPVSTALSPNLGVVSKTTFAVSFNGIAGASSSSLTFAWMSIGTVAAGTV